MNTNKRHASALADSHAVAIFPKFRFLISFFLFFLLFCQVLESFPEIRQNIKIEAAERLAEVQKRQKKVAPPPLAVTASGAADAANTVNASSTNTAITSSGNEQKRPNKIETGDLVQLKSGAAQPTSADKASTATTTSSSSTASASSSSSSTTTTAATSTGDSAHLLKSVDDDTQSNTVFNRLTVVEKTTEAWTESTEFREGSNKLTTGVDRQELERDTIAVINGQEIAPGTASSSESELAVAGSANASLSPPALEGNSSALSDVQPLESDYTGNGVALKHVQGTRGSKKKFTTTLVPIPGRPHRPSQVGGSPLCTTTL